jgi:plastocyanin
MTTRVVLSLLFFLAGSTAIAGGIKGKVKARGWRHSGDAVVHIENIPGKTFSAPEKHATMDQKNLIFIPHVLPVLVGTTVDYVNSDDVLHNVFSPDKCAEKFNLGTWPKGQTRSFSFKAPNCFSAMLCNVHPEMEAYVVVLDNPYHAVSAKDGSYEIKNVPAGKYTLKIWHEKLKGQSVEVEVPEKGEVVVDFEIKR